jgi:hypothetical protein
LAEPISAGLLLGVYSWRIMGGHFGREFVMAAA